MEKHSYPFVQIAIGVCVVLGLISLWLQGPAVMFATFSALTCLCAGIPGQTAFLIPYIRTQKQLQQEIYSLFSFLRASSALVLQEQIRMLIETICVVLHGSSSTKTSK